MDLPPTTPSEPASDIMLTESQRDAAWQAETVLSTVMNRLGPDSDTAELVEAIRKDFREVYSCNRLNPVLFENAVQDLRSISERLAAEMNDLGLQLDIALLLAQLVNAA